MSQTSNFNEPPGSGVPAQPFDANRSPGAGPGKILFFVFGGCALVVVLMLVGIISLGVVVFRTASSGIETSVDRAYSLNQIREISIGLFSYETTNKGLPASYNTDGEGRPLLSWRVHLLPYLEQQTLYNQFHLDEPWDSPHNKTLIELMPQVYRSPFSDSPLGYTTYLGNAVDEGLFSKPDGPMKDSRDYQKAGLTLDDCSDGTIDTLILVEANDDHAVIWTQPGDFEPDINSDLFSWLMISNGDFLGSFYNGSTIIQPANNISNLRAQLTRDGGETIENPWD